MNPLTPNEIREGLLEIATETFTALTNVSTEIERLRFAWSTAKIDAPSSFANDELDYLIDQELLFRSDDLEVTLHSIQDCLDTMDV